MSYLKQREQVHRQKILIQICLETHMQALCAYTQGKAFHRKLGLQKERHI